jgi:segregation and condensation protein A
MTDVTDPLNTASQTDSSIKEESVVEEIVTEDKGAQLASDQDITPEEKDKPQASENPQPVVKVSEQQEMPFALVHGEALTQLPLDLYIPPDALEVILEQFEGPLDLLLYLIRKQNLDILEVNVSEITIQYMHYVDLMQTVHLELAGEYLVMAAMLAEIKSRILLPRPETESEEEEDPRAELIRRLQDYERFKKAAEELEEFPRIGRDIYEVEIKPPEYNAEKTHPDVDFKDLILAFGDILHRSEMFTEHEVHREKLSTRERMSQILAGFQGDQFIPFTQLFTYEEGRSGVVVTFLAMLELIKEQLVEIVQNELFGAIHVKAKSS